MVLNILDNKIRQAFSDAALQYDVLTSMHKEIGKDLIRKIMDIEPCERILDVGMGTGALTRRLSFYFPDTRVVGIDFAPGMVAFANKQREGFDIVQADAATLPFKEQVFDIIVSNLTYQWIKDLPKAFRLCHASLKEGGVFYFTMFGRHTLEELFQSLEKTKNGKGHQRVMNRLASQDQIKEAVGEAGFKDVTVDYERIKVHFPHMMDLVRWLKDIGANALGHQAYIGKDWFKRANDYYNQNFRERFGIRTTFEVIWVEAKK